MSSAIVENSLYAQLVDWSNLLIAYRKAARHKRGKASAAHFEHQLTDHLLELQDELTRFTYRPGAYHHFFIHDPKTRKISAAPFRDRVVHHACYTYAVLQDETANQKTLVSSFSLREKEAGRMRAKKTRKIDSPSGEGGGDASRRLGGIPLATFGCHPLRGRSLRSLGAPEIQRSEALATLAFRGQSAP